jgi:hypothetical protein
MTRGAEITPASTIVLALQGSHQGELRTKEGLDSQNYDD